jgi:hypothetical protein
MSQLCGKLGHVVQCYRKRFDRDFTGEEKMANMVTSPYGVNTNWCTDTGTTDHITSELDKLTMKGKCGGHEQVHAANGARMHISHIGHTSFHTPLRKIHLNKVLFVPKAHKILVSIHHFTKDNNVYLQYHPHHFFVKDQATKRTLLESKCEGSLYPLPSVSQGPDRRIGQALAAATPSSLHWHDRLGHPSLAVVQRVMKEFGLSCQVVDEKVCDACQQAKSHRLPYLVCLRIF